jgi:hypothetical protein
MRSRAGSGTLLKGRRPSFSRRRRARDEKKNRGRPSGGRTIFPPLFYCARRTIQYNEGRISGMSGYNTRVEYKGSTYIVQTQDKGLAAQYVESLIYKSGKLLTSKKTFYTSSLSSSDVKAVIERMMEVQHKKILEEIVEGKFA